MRARNVLFRKNRSVLWEYGEETQGLGINVDIFIVIDPLKTGTIEVGFDLGKKIRQDLTILLIESFERDFFCLAHRLLDGANSLFTFPGSGRHRLGAHLPEIIAFRETPDSSGG